MLHTRKQNEFGTWYIAGRKPVIFYSLSLMARLAEQSKVAAPKPVGGVLFGTLEDSEIRVTMARPVQTAPIPVDSKVDSAFDEDGEAALNRLVSSYASDPELAGLRPVGWYRSRADDVIQMSQGDLRIWNGFFPHIAQVTLVMRVGPRNGEEPVRAGFFFRPPQGGPVRTESSYRTFAIEPAPEASADVGRLAAAVIGSEPEAIVRATIEPDPVPFAVEPAAAEPAVNGAGSRALQPPPELYTPPVQAARRIPRVWAATGLATLLVAGVGGYLYWFGSRPTERLRAATDVSLSFKGTPDRLRLVWDPRSESVVEADSAELRIIDGESDTKEMLTAAVLREGGMTLQNRTGQVEARLRLLPLDVTKPTLGVTAQYVGPTSVQANTLPLEEAETGPAKTNPKLAALRKEIARLRGSIHKATTTNDGLSARIREVKRQREETARLAEKPALVAAAVAPPAPAAAGVSPAAVTPPPVANPPSPAAQQLQQPQPQAPSPQQAAPSTPQQSVAAAAPGPNFGSDRIPARQASAPEVPPAPVYSGPASGKLIWTGFLPPGETITIDGRKPSRGNLNAALPGVPVRLAVFPAELNARGITVYSAAPRHQSGTVTESKSAQNAWLNVRYVYDPARAREVQVAAPPNAAGGYRQMQIRGGERPISVVVIEWAVTGQ